MKSGPPHFFNLVKTFEFDVAVDNTVVENLIDLDEA